MPLLLHLKKSRALKETDEAPIEWQYGRLNNVKYYLGPELRESGWKVKLDVKTPHHQQMASIVLFNTIGVLRGEHEPGKKLRGEKKLSC